MAKIQYDIDVRFLYKDGLKGGRLHTQVNSKGAIKIQMGANRRWLAIKGHKLISVAITPLTKERREE